MRMNALAALAGLALAACAATENGSTAAAGATTAAGTQYCWQERLDTSGGKHTCNWSADKRSACEGTTFTALEAQRYAAPRKGSRCANGQWLVELSPRG